MRGRLGIVALHEAVSRRPRLVLIAALLVTLVALPLAGRQEERLTAGGFEDSTAQSAAVSRAIESGAFPGMQVAPLAVVLEPRAGARPGDLERTVARVSEQVAAVDDVRVAERGRRAALASARRDPGRPVTLPLAFEGGVDYTIDLARDLTPELGIDNPEAGSAADGRVAVRLVGEGALWAAFIERASEDSTEAEARGLPVSGLILLLAFGSLAAAALPLALGTIAVIVTSAIIYLLSFATSMSIFAASTASMIGLGVAIDYSLFVLVRYREEVRAGLDPLAARSRAMATSGRAVAFSGLTVVVSLCALFLIESPGVRSIAVGTIIVVSMSVLVAATVLPLLIRLLGRRAHEPGRLGRWRERRRERRGAPPQGAFWERWTRVVMRRPGLSLLVASALLLALAAPALQMEVQNSATNQLPRDHQVREGMRMLAAAQGPGSVGPVHVLVGARSRAALREPVARVRRAVARDPAVASVGPPRIATDGRRALVPAILRTDPESRAARDSVDRLRERLPAAAGAASVDVGGTTGIILDFDRLVTADLWRPILFVLAASFLVLLVLLRSLALPLKATLMNVLSVGAAYGALVGVFQLGWLEWAGVDTAATIYPITLPLVLTICFGLSMDYHIFLLTRIRERYLATGDNRRAVAEALASSATPITSAALIMVAVFMAFVSAGAPSIQQLGFAAAVAIAVDATIVRLVIVPAAMELLGEWNWWLPRPLARLLPARALSVEGEPGETLARAPEPAAAGAGAEAGRGA